MFEEIWKNHTGACLAVAALVTLALLALILVKMLKVAAGLAIVAIGIPILAVIFWGNGAGYVDSLTRLLDEPKREQILESYAFYRFREEQDPIIDFGGMAEVLGRMR